jgi:hypothetical protein
MARSRWRGYHSHLSKKAAAALFKKAAVALFRKAAAALFKRAAAALALQCINPDRV